MTDDQHLDLQRDALHLQEIESIYEETSSGTTYSRLKLEPCPKALQATLLCCGGWIGQRLPDLARIVTGLEKKVGFESIAFRPPALLES